MLGGIDTYHNERAYCPNADQSAVSGVIALPAPTWYEPCKRVIELVLAVVLLVACLPVILLCALLVKLTSRGPALYTQTRVGRFGQPYVIFKLRTMYHDCEERSGPQWARPGDPRITPLGRFLRRTHLDELPQLWNVICGEMSLIGPRPERPEFTAHLEKAIPNYCGRLAVRPGLTGLAQLRLPPDTDLGSVRRKLVYDLYYIRRSGPGLDLLILLGTACYFLGMPVSLPAELD
jgi:lipopolysaccharide/colanic/teichoic acid biosynthesis glycosyltransferase